MKPKFSVGELVQTVKGWQPSGKGTIREIKQASTDLQALWGESQPHYIIRDIETGEYLSVIEKGLEKA